jgi:hypothetical protein
MPCVINYNNRRVCISLCYFSIGTYRHTRPIYDVNLFIIFRYVKAVLVAYTYEFILLSRVCGSMTNNNGGWVG